MFEERYYIPENRILRNKILRTYHDYAGHFGMRKTSELINRMFYWPDSGKEIQDYVSQCISCQRNKSQNRHPYGLLQPLPIPSMPFDSISMDFIVNLPESKGYNCLLTVTDRLTKMVRLIPCRTDATANDIADVFIDQIVKLHGIPKEIISDRDTKFNSDFWKSLMKSFNVELKMSTTNHPQHDGQSERSNRNVITT